MRMLLEMDASIVYRSVLTSFGTPRVEDCVPMAGCSDRFVPSRHSPGPKVLL